MVGVGRKFSGYFEIVEDSIKRLNGYYSIDVKLVYDGPCHETLKSGVATLKIEVPEKVRENEDVIRPWIKDAVDIYYSSGLFNLSEKDLDSVENLGTLVEIARRMAANQIASRKPITLFEN